MTADPFTATLPSIRVGFTGSPLDRADQLRRDDTALERLRRDPAARFLALVDLRPIVSTGDAAESSDASGGDAVAAKTAISEKAASGNAASGKAGPERVGPGGTRPAAAPADPAVALLWLTAAEIPADAPWIFLGLQDDQPRFAVSVAEGAVTRGTPIEVRAAAALVSDGDAAILAQARSLFAWHQRHAHCAVCGAPTRVAKGGYMRQCESDTCRSEHFPRTDPVVIMLVIDRARDRCVLGRHGRLAPGVYSTLAGFVEPAETIEEAVAREVWEEVGVRVGRVRYVASQLWPFPSSLMIGCFADALTHDLQVDQHELEHATWFTLDDVGAALAGSGPFVCPPPFTIAHTLLRTWWTLSTDR
jgi:NAD+ diphosphatase